MKKITAIILAAAAAALLAACTPSSIENQETQMIPEGATIPKETTMGWTVPPTSKYVIPADAPTGEAGGPGAMQTTAVDYSVYPEGKRPVVANPEDEGKTLVIIYRQTDDGLRQDFDAVEVCDADSLIASLGKNGAFREGTEVEAFTVGADGAAVLKLNKLSIYSGRDEYVVLSGIANTFIDNLGVKSVQILIGDEDYGTYEFTYGL